jgi:hypothetical protein
MIDAIEIQLGPVDLALRTYARQQPGCRTLIEKINGIGELTSVTILAQLGDPRRFQNSRDAVRYSGLDITVHQSDQRRSPRASQSARTNRVALGAIRGRTSRASTRQPRPPVLPAGRRADRRQPRVHRGRAQATEAQLPPPARTRRAGHAARRRLSTLPVTRQARNHPMNRGQLPPPSCRPLPGNSPERLSGRTLICRNTDHIMYPTGSHPASRTEVRLGVRGHAPIPQRAHAPPTPKSGTADNHQRLDNSGRHREGGTRRRTPESAWCLRKADRRRPRCGHAHPREAAIPSVAKRASAGAGVSRRMRSRGAASTETWLSPFAGLSSEVQKATRCLRRVHAAPAPATLAMLAAARRLEEQWSGGGRHDCSVTDGAVRRRRGRAAAARPRR